MTILAYPSADFPGLLSRPPDLCDGWEAAHAPGILMAARLPHEVTA